MRLLSQNSICYNTWVEHIMHEVGTWNVAGFIQDGRHINCPVNRTLLNELRLKYHINHDVY
jgi:hypothetical protein